MTPEQSAAYVFAEAVSALSELEAMKAANQEREMQGYSPAYGEEDFRALQDRFVISHNGVMNVFNQ